MSSWTKHEHAADELLELTGKCAAEGDLAGVMHNGFAAVVMELRSLKTELVAADGVNQNQ